ncbi:MAG: ATP-binding protein [Elusimicrobia bacterium]|nr:ATP-binding protein [Elusimicrobiota bacterium]
MDRILPKSLRKHWDDPKGLIQVFTGPRQVGKTTAALGLMEPAHRIYADADLPTPPTPDFITQHWRKARELPTAHRTLILDEVQKIPRWSEVVKQLWDEDQRGKTILRVCILGSSALLLDKGLAESLTGRFEVSYFPHWTYAECRDCFGAAVEEYADIGGYPKAYDLRGDHARLESYLRDGILEPTLGRDILALRSVDKPALLRQLFWYVSRLPAQIVSYEKILGHLQGRGNSATLVHYAELLATAFLLVPLSKFSRRPHRTKRSIPKWIVANPGLVDKSVKHAGLQGFVFENLIGSHLLNILFGRKDYRLQFWREEPFEIDFIVTRDNEPVAAFEVKSGRAKKPPALRRLERTEIGCPVRIISKEGAAEFLGATSIEDILGPKNHPPPIP